MQDCGESICWVVMVNVSCILRMNVNNVEYLSCE